MERRLSRSLLTSCLLLSIAQVYDIATNEWTTYADLPAEYQLSDLAGFAYGTEAFFAGGYQLDYTAVSTVFAIDAVNTAQTGTLSITPKSSMMYSRGDLSSATTSATDDDEASAAAFAAGGFTHENDFCSALTVVERYDFATDTWQELAPLTTGRSDKAVVYLTGYLFVLGGESQLDNICELADEPEPGEQTIAIDDVEVYDPETNQWIVLEDFPQHRFRFTAVAVNEEHKIITFGGQTAFDEDCLCFRTTDEIVVYTEKLATATPAPVEAPVIVEAPVATEPVAAPVVEVPVATTPVAAPVMEASAPSKTSAAGVVKVATAAALVGTVMTLLW
jgi:N-acetylneuraminic acid mutarotase